jgi:hypothetical protein
MIVLQILALVFFWVLVGVGLSCFCFLVVGDFFNQRDHARGIDPWVEAAERKADLQVRQVDPRLAAQLGIREDSHG